MKHEQEETSQLMWGVPKAEQRMLDTIANKHGIDPQKFLQRSILLGLALDLAEQEGGEAFFRRHGRMRKIDLGNRGHATRDVHGNRVVNFNHEARAARIDPFSTINPRRDARVLVNSLRYENGQRIHVAEQPVQREGQALVREAAQAVLATHRALFTPEQKRKLLKIHEGVIVASNTKKLIPDLISKTDIPAYLRPFQGALIAFTDVHGMVMGHLDAIILDEKYIREEDDMDDKLHTAAHEIWHVIQDNNLPELLNEAHADMQAQVSVASNTNPEERMFGDFKYAFPILSWIETTLGQKLTFEMFTTQPVVELKENKKSKKVESVSFLDSRPHEVLRDVLGTDNKGRNKWDKVVALLEQKKLRQAHDYLFDISRLTRLARWFV